MGVFSKLKSAAQSVTGGAAKVSIEYPLQMVFPGENMNVKVTVMSSGGEVKSKGIFVDLLAEEMVSGTDGARCPQCGNSFKAPFKEKKKVIDQKVPVAPAFVLGAGETKVFEANVQVPGGAQPTYSGPQAHHDWKIRGRLQAFGNDPDSGYQSIRVGVKQ